MRIYLLKRGDTIISEPYAVALRLYYRCYGFLSQTSTLGLARLSLGASPHISGNLP